MKLINHLMEGIAFVIVIIVLFNMLTQFLQTLGLFDNGQMGYLGSIAVLLAVDNVLTRKFFGYTFVG